MPKSVYLIMIIRGSGLLCAQAISEEDPAFGVIAPSSPWRAEAVEALPGYRLAVRFFDGTAGIVNMSALVKSPDAGVFAVLADPQRFAEVYVEFGAVTWPGELDLAPDAMHTEIRAHGEWRLS